MVFKIEKIDNGVEADVYYILTKYKTVKDVNGVDVDIVDSVQNITIQELLDKKSQLEASLIEVQLYIDEINKE